MTSGASLRPGEFELIAKLFAPLARDMYGAFGLTDDVALLKPPRGYELVLKTDSLIEGVHFLRGDPPETVGRKALRRALSDLAAKGAEPSCYLLALALPEWPEISWLEAFAGGLASDQREFGISLGGGETNATPGPLTLTITALGQVPEGTLIRRSGAKAGDFVYVTGTIGDAGAGVAIAQDTEAPTTDAASAFLLARYRLPVPRFAIGQALRRIASAAIDVSDGLLADLAHIAENSRVRVAIDSARVPLSDALRKFWGTKRDALLCAATAGDDYEIAFTAPESAAAAVREAARKSATKVTELGRVVVGDGVAFLDDAGNEIAVTRPGYTHF